MNSKKFSSGTLPIFHNTSAACVIFVILQLLLCSDAYYLDGDPYRQKQILGPKSSYVVEWSVNWKEKSITFQVSAETKGWVGFGLSRDGRMTNSDVIIGGVSPSGKPYFDDAHVLGNRTIQIDSQQDWKLIGAWEKGKRTYLTVKRALQTCDSDDFQITKDLVFLIWAYGADDEVAYHNKLRGSAPAYLLDPQISDEIAHDHYRQLGPHSNLYLVQRWALTNMLKLEPKPTTVWCSVQRGPRLLARHDIVGMGAFLPTKMARRHVQQLRVFKCASPQQTDAKTFFEPYVKSKGEECYMNEKRTFPLGFCRELLYVHGRGSQPFYFPEEIGIPIGESQEEYFLLETTYDNPKTVPNLEIEAGVEIIFSHRQKPNAASLIQVGYGTFGTFMLPPKSVMSIYGSCGPRCTSTMFPKNGVNVFAAMLQTRSLGRKIRLRHFREDQELKWILKDDNYDSEFQQMRLLHHDVTLLPGDQLTTQCTFNSYSRNRTSFSGFSTQDEICTAYMYVSTRIPFFTCTSEYPQEKILTRFGINNVTWDLTWQERYVTEPNELEGVWLGDIVDHKAHARSVNHDQLQRDLQYNQHLESCPNIDEIMGKQTKVFRTFDRTLDSVDPIEARSEYMTSTVSYPQNVNEYRDAPDQCKDPAAPPPLAPQRPRPAVSQPFSTVPEGSTEPPRQPTAPTVAQKFENNHVISSNPFQEGYFDSFEVHPNGPPPAHNPQVLDYSIPRDRPSQKPRIAQPLPDGPSGPPPSHNPQVDYPVPRERPLQRLRPAGDITLSAIPKGPTGPPPTRRPTAPRPTTSHNFDNPFQEGYFDSLDVHQQPLKPPFKEVIFGQSHQSPESPFRTFRGPSSQELVHSIPQGSKRPTTPPPQPYRKPEINSSREQMINKLSRRPPPSPPPFEDATPTKRPVIQYFDEQFLRIKKPSPYYPSDDVYSNQRPPAEEQSQRPPENNNPVLEYFEELSNRKPPSSKEQISRKPTNKPSLHYNFGEELPRPRPTARPEDQSHNTPTNHPVIEYFENLNRRPPTQSAQSLNQQRPNIISEEEFPGNGNPAVEYNFAVPQHNGGPPTQSSREQSLNHQPPRPSSREQLPGIRNPAVEYNFAVPQHNGGPPTQSEQSSGQHPPRPSSREKLPGYRNPAVEYNFAVPQHSRGPPTREQRPPTERRPPVQFNVGEPLNAGPFQQEARNQAPRLQYDNPRPAVQQQPRIRVSQQPSRQPTERPASQYDERPYHNSDPIQQSIYISNTPTKKLPPPRSSEEHPYVSKPSVAYFEEPSHKPNKQPALHYSEEGPYRLPKLPNNRPEPEDPIYNDKVKITQSQYSEESPKSQPPQINSIEEPRQLKRPRLYYSDQINQHNLPPLRDSQEAPPPRKLKRVNIYESSGTRSSKKKSSSEERHQEDVSPYQYEPLKESPLSREPIQEHSTAPQPRKPSSPPTNLKLMLGNTLFDKPSDTSKDKLFGAVGKNVVGDQQSFLKFFEQLANVFTPNSRSGENQSLELSRTLASLKEGISVQNHQQLSKRIGSVEEKKPQKNNIKLLIVQQTKHDG